MRPSFEPYSDCGPPVLNPNHSTRIGPLWIVQAIQLIVAIAYAYNSIKDNSSNLDNMLRDIDKKLDFIQLQLESINRGIDQIIDLLNDMPRIIRGEVEVAAIKEILGRADQRIALIRDNIRPQFIDQNVDAIREMVDNLQVELGGVIGLRGVSSILCIAPYLPTWLAGAVAVQKARKRKDGNWNIQPPWDASFMKQCSAMFSELFSQVEAQDRDFDTRVIPQFPPHDTNLKVEHGAFVRASAITTQPYRMTCPGLNDSEHLQYGVPSANPGRFDWYDVPSGGNSFPEASAAWSRFTQTRKEVIAFYEFLPQVYQAKNAIQESFVEPIGFWDVNK